MDRKWWAECASPEDIARARQFEDEQAVRRAARILGIDVRLTEIKERPEIASRLVDDLLRDIRQYTGVGGTGVRWRPLTKTIQDAEGRWRIAQYPPELNEKPASDVAMSDKQPCEPLGRGVKRGR